MLNFKLSVVSVLALALAMPVLALPEDPSAIRVVSEIYTVPSTSDVDTTDLVVSGRGTSDLEERQAGQPTTVETHCYCVNNQNPDRNTAAKTIADYIDSVAAAGRKCVVDKKQAYYTLASTKINGKTWEASFFLTGRQPLTTKAVFDCKVVAKELRALRSRCQTQCNSNRVLEWTTLINCISTPTFSKQPQQPFVEGAVGLEFREVGAVAARPPKYQ